jgi:hypothetical protein
MQGELRAEPAAPIPRRKSRSCRRGVRRMMVSVGTCDVPATLLVRATEVIEEEDFRGAK